jgi:hypothetical protein
LPVSKLPAEVNELLDAKLLGEFENGSPEWHELRNEPGAVGGSDIAAIAGLSAWESAITKWAKKTGQIPDELTPNMSMKLGTALEAPILDLFAAEHPELEIYTTGTWANKTYEWARSNPDGLYKTATGDFGIVTKPLRNASGDSTKITLTAGLSPKTKPQYKIARLALG